MPNKFPVFKIILFVLLGTATIVELLDFFNISTLLRIEWTLSFRIVVCLYIILYLVRKSTLDRPLKFLCSIIPCLVICINFILFEGIPTQKEIISPNKTHYIMTIERHTFDAHTTFLDLYERKFFFFKVYDQTLTARYTAQLMKGSYCTVKWLDENSLYICILNAVSGSLQRNKEEYIIKY